MQTGHVTVDDDLWPGILCQDHDGRTDPFEDDDMMEVYSRRSLGSNWDRYEESEKAEPADDSPTQRGSDFQVLLESAGELFRSLFGFASFL